jgi:hypothetical protein
MSQQQPQMFDLDPEQAPRMTAIILLACGLLGVGFMLINLLGTGDDPYYIESEWNEGREPVNQRYDIMPNMIRGRQVTGDSEEDEEAKIEPIKKAAKPTTSPFQNPFALPSRPMPGTPATPAGAAPPPPGTPAPPSGSGLTTPGAATGSGGTGAKPAK